MNELVFLKVKFGHTVLVGEHEISKVLSFVWGAREPHMSHIFQVANIDSWAIKFAHSEEMKQILSKRK